VLIDQKKDPWRKMPAASVPSTIDMPRELLEALRGNELLLDIGCGYAANAFTILRSHVRQYIGLDINESLLLSSLHHSLAPEGQFALVGANALNLPFHSGVFDVAIMKAVLTLLLYEHDRAEALSEVRRVLRQGGRIYIADFCQTWTVNKYRARYLAGRKATGELGTFPVVDASSGEIKYYAHHLTLMEITQLLKVAGFEMEYIHSYPQSFRTASGNTIDGLVACAFAT